MLRERGRAYMRGRQKNREPCSRVQTVDTAGREVHTVPPQSLDRCATKAASLAPSRHPIRPGVHRADRHLVIHLRGSSTSPRTRRRPSRDSSVWSPPLRFPAQRGPQKCLIEHIRISVPPRASRHPFFRLPSPRAPTPSSASCPPDQKYPRMRIDTNGKSVGATPTYRAPYDDGART